MTGSVAIDHVLFAVPDLVVAAADLRSRDGLVALEGGRHPGAGTANMIVPLGPDYLELIAIVDRREAADNPLSRRVSAALERGARIATWAVRVPALEPAAARIRDAGLGGTGPRAGARRRPDGVTLRWRTLHVGDGLEPVLPFFIEWDLQAADHPGALPVSHPAGDVQLRGLRLTARQPRQLAELIERLVGCHLPLEIGPGQADAISAVVLSVDGSERIME